MASDRDENASVIERPRLVFRKASPERPEAVADLLTVEEPLEIRLGTIPLTVLMRTPGNDLDLVAGFAITERILPRAEDVERIRHCSEGDGDNVMVIYPKPGIDVDVARFQRSFLTTASCGVCGTRSLAQALREAAPLPPGPEWPPELIFRLPELCRNLQLDFSKTGGLHAAALMAPNGSVAFLREDIGRHNAVDKVVGAAWRANLAIHEHLLFVSGRCSFEIIQKALAARISAVAAVGAISSLAAELAERAGIVLYGFVSESRVSRYAPVPVFES